MGAVGLRIGWLLRRHWRATLLFTLVAGLAGGVSLAAWAAARRTDAVFEHFLAVADVPELTVTFCPPDVTSVDARDLGACLDYDARAELEVVRGLPEVVAAGRGAFRAGLIRSLDRRDELGVAYLSAMLDADIVTPNGRPAIVAGRVADADAPDEIMVNEAFLREYRVALRERLSIEAFGEGEDETTPSSERRGGEVPVRIVGVARTPQDLIAANHGDRAQVSAQLFTRPGVDRRMPGAATAFAAILVQARDGDASRTRAALERAFPGRVFNNQYGFSADDVVPLRDAYRYEADAALAVAVLTALAALIFVGQAMARQVRREWSDMGALRALGLSPRQAGLTAAGRSAVIGLGAAALAGSAAVALSALTPVGNARLAELRPGVQLDPLVLAVGLAAVVVGVMAMAVLPVIRLAGSSTGARRNRPLLVPPRALNPPMTAGLGMAVNGGRVGNGLPVGTALFGVALAAAGLVGAAGLVASLDRLVTTPRSYGAPWDRSISSFQPGEPAGARQRLADLPGVERAAALYGTELVIGGESTWGIALEPLDGHTPVVAPTIIRGREGIRPTEITLGELTMERLHLRVGDQVAVASSLAGLQPSEMTVVGVAVMNSTDETSPGLGAVLPPEAFHQLAPEVTADILVVGLSDDDAGREARAALEAEYHDQLSGPIRQPAIRNAERLRPLPWVLAAIVALLAGGSLAHALVLSVRRNRRELAVLKTLGFTRRQVSAAVAWQASMFVALAMVVGLPVGVLLSRIGWRQVAAQLGVASPAVVPALAVVLVAIAALAFANLVSLGPGRRAAGIRPADALRTE